MYDEPNLNIYADEHFGQRYSSGDYNEGLLHFKMFNVEEYIARRKECQKRCDEQMMYRISIGAIGYTIETYKEEQRFMETRMNEAVKKFEGIFNNPVEYERVMKEFERRKEFNIEKLESYGIDMT